MPRQRNEINKSLPTGWRWRGNNLYYMVPKVERRIFDEKQEFRLGSNIKEATKVFQERMALWGSLAPEVGSLDILEVGGEPAAVYRHYDVNGVLLYIGMSSNPLTRLSSHQNKTNWGLLVSNITLEWFDSNTRAKNAERLAIETERPKYNIKHQIPK